jgi:diguanylate cyclase
MSHASRCGKENQSRGALGFKPAARRADASKKAMRGSTSEVLVDTLAAVVRDFGRFSFDVDAAEARRTALLFEQWAQHVLTGAPPPGLPAPPSSALEARQLPGLRRAFGEHRRAEQQHVERSGEAFREVVWAFVTGMNRLASQDGTEDASLEDRLHTLRTAVETATLQELKAQVVATVDDVSRSISRRRARQTEALQALATRVSSLGAQLEVAQKASTTDALTGLYNRRALDEHLEHAVALAGMTGGGLTVVMADLDAFKQVNDTHGHPAGDAVLQAVAQALTRAFKRKSDFVARWGGEELCAVLKDTSADEAERLAERLRAQVEATPVQAPGKALTVTLSLGVAQWRAGETPAQVVARADAALYAAKSGGRNRVARAD